MTSYYTAVTSVGSFHGALGRRSHSVPSRLPGEGRLYGVTSRDPVADVKTCPASPKARQQAPPHQSFYEQSKRRRNRELRDQIRAQADTQSILDLVAERGEFWDAIGLSTALHAVACKCREGSQRPDFRRDAQWINLQHLLRMKLEDADARNLANNMWSLASMSCTDWPFMEDIVTSLLGRVTDLKTQEVSNSCWAFAVAKCHRQDLFHRLAGEMMLKVRDGGNQDLVNTLWAFATAAFAHAPLFELLCDCACHGVLEFKAQELANSIWALATIPFKHEGLILDISHQVLQSMFEFRTQNIANFIWAYAKLAYSDTSIIHCVQAETCRKLSHFSAQDCVTSMWAFSTMPHRDEAFFMSCFSILQDKARSAGMIPQQASNTLWAFATVPLAHDDAFEFLCKSVQECIQEFKPQESANSIWALATVTWKHEGLVFSVSRQILKTISEISTQSLSNFVWAYAKLAYDEDLVIQGVQAEALHKMRFYSEQDLSTTVWAFSTMPHRNDSFLKTWVDIVHQRAQTQVVHPQHASNMLWALATVPFHDSQCFSVLTKSILQRLSAFCAQDLSCSIWACATVAHNDRIFVDAVAREAAKRMKTFDPQSIGNTIWAVSHMDTTVCEIYQQVFLQLQTGGSLQHCNAKVLSMVARALFRGQRPELAWSLFDQLQAAKIDPGINALGVWFHQCRHVQPDAMRELQALKELARFRPCPRLAVVVLNAAALRLAELGHSSVARQLATQLLAVSAGNSITASLLRRLEGVPDATETTHHLLQLATVDWNLVPMHDHARCDYRKECQLLQHVLATSRPGDPESIIRAIEGFSVDGNGWLKIAGDGKGAVLDDIVQVNEFMHQSRPMATRLLAFWECMDPCASFPQALKLITFPLLTLVAGLQVLAPHHPKLVLEFGCYVGYSASRMARLLRKWGGRVVSVEVDPVHACIARSVVEYAGLAASVSIHIGYSEEAIPNLHRTLGKSQADIVFMDQRGTRFHIDLDALQAQKLLVDGCVVAADNVLKPGAPHFLWYLQESHEYQLTVVSLREFACESIEDWISVAHYQPSAEPAGPLPEPAASLEHLAFLTDRVRKRACASDSNYEVDERAWAQHAQEVREAYVEAGIRPHIVHVCRRSDGTPFVDWRLATKS